jgi:hypothetical protein
MAIPKSWHHTEDNAMRYDREKEEIKKNPNYCPPYGNDGEYVYLPDSADIPWYCWLRSFNGQPWACKYCYALTWVIWKDPAEPSKAHSCCLRESCYSKLKSFILEEITK